MKIVKAIILSFVLIQPALAEVPNIGDDVDVLVDCNSGAKNLVEQSFCDSLRRIDYPNCEIVVQRATELFHRFPLRASRQQSVASREISQLRTDLYQIQYTVVGFEALFYNYVAVRKNGFSCRAYAILADRM